MAAIDNKILNLIRVSLYLNFLLKGGMMNCRLHYYLMVQNLTLNLNLNPVFVVAPYIFVQVVILFVADFGSLCQV
jgi:hypothetical protein